MGMSYEESIQDILKREAEHHTQSCQPCGCDEGANHQCAQHRDVSAQSVHVEERPLTEPMKAALDGYTGERWPYPASQKPLNTNPVGLPTTPDHRKHYPLWTGVMLYFPDAMLAVSEVSRVGNEQHNPNEPLHWAREKSTDQMNTATRHMLDHSLGNHKDTDGTWHLAKAVWRLCAELQLAIEQEQS